MVEAVGVIALVLIVTLALAYFHWGYKNVGLALAMRGFAYEGTDKAGDYLREVGKGVTENISDERAQVEALIVWIRHNMRVREQLPHHPNPAYLISEGGACGRFSDVLVDLLRANGMEARGVLLKGSEGETSHVVTEVMTDGTWVAFDPLGFGTAFPSSEYVSNIQENGRGASILDLYLRPELLPKGKYGETLFRQGQGFKVEVRDEYAEFLVEPKFIYGRDWPEARVNDAESWEWLYDGTAGVAPKNVVISHFSPFFSRVIVWFGTRPLVFHFEWAPLLIAGAWYPLFRLERKLDRRQLFFGGATVMVLLAIYFASAVLLAWQHFTFY